MQRTGYQLLAGAGLALDQDIGVGGRHFADLAVQVLHGRAGADDADFAVMVAGAAFGGGCRLARRFRRMAGRRLSVAQDAGHGLEHLVVVKRLGDVVHRAHFHGVHRRAQAGVTGHDQHRRALAELDQFGAGGARQAQVADDQVKRWNAETFLCFLH